MPGFVPTVARKGVKNFFDNLFFPIRFINDLLQGKGEAACMEFSAFFINSTLGFGGLNDFAQKYVGITLQDEDFGQTLGSYGVGNGCYILLPILGPSSLRDAVGRAGGLVCQSCQLCRARGIVLGGLGA